MNTDTAKNCTKCGEIKPFSDFHRAKSFKDGMAYICKMCSRERRRKNYLRSREHSLEVIRQYALEHKEAISAYQKEYRTENLEQILADGYVYRAANKDKRSAREKERRRASPETSILNSAKGRAKLFGLPFSIEQADIVIPDFCPILGTPMTIGNGRLHPESPTLDKIIPELGYIKGNVAVISHRANAIKSNGSAAEHRLIADWLDGKPSAIKYILQPASRSHAGILVTSAKVRARKRNIPFTISPSDIFIPDVCPILGIPIKRGSRKMHDGSPTLDQIAIGLGYVPSNIAVISLRANRMKNDATAEEHRKVADWMDAQLELLAA